MNSHLSVCPSAVAAVWSLRWGGIEPNLGVPISLPNGAHLGKGALASLFFWEPPRGV